MKKLKILFFMMFMSIMTFFVACSEDSVSMGEDNSVQFRDNFHQKDNSYYCNAVVLPTHIEVYGLTFGLEKSVKVYWCCGPGLGIPPSGCSIVPKKFYDIWNEDGVEDPIKEIGVPVKGLVDGIKEISDSANVISFTVEDCPFVNGLRIKKGIYKVDSDGLVHFELESL